MVVRGQREDRLVEADGVADALDDGGFQIVVPDDPGTDAPSREGVHVAAQEIGHGLAVVEAQEDLARPCGGHDEAQEAALGAADLDLAEMAPVALSDFAGKRTQSHECLGHWPGPESADDGAEMIRPAGVAALLDHLEKAAGAELGVLLEGLDHEGDVRVGDRGAQDLGGIEARLTQHALDRGMVDAKLAGDRADEPFFCVIQAQDLGLAIGGDHLPPLDGGPRRRAWSASSASTRRSTPGRRLSKRIGLGAHERRKQVSKA